MITNWLGGKKWTTIMLLASITLQADVAASAGKENAIFEGMAHKLVDGLDANLPLRETLQREKLDFSLESLRVVDAYLCRIHNVLPKTKQGEGDVSVLPKESLVAVVMQAGGYLGEVMRRHSEQDYFWVSFEEWVTAFPERRALMGGQASLGTAYLLRTQGSSMSVPLNQVLKVLASGEEGIHLHAVVSIRRGKDRTYNHCRVAPTS